MRKRERDIRTRALWYARKSPIMSAKEPCNMRKRDLCCQHKILVLALWYPHNGSVLCVKETYNMRKRERDRRAQNWASTSTARSWRFIVLDDELVRDARSSRTEFRRQELVLDVKSLDSFLTFLTSRTSQELNSVLDERVLGWFLTPLHFRSLPAKEPYSIYQRFP